MSILLAQKEQKDGKMIRNAGREWEYVMCVCVCV